MSFASSRIPNQLASASIGLVIQQDEDAGIVLPLTLVSGDLEPLASIELQQGVWTGFAEISVQGDATTVIEYFNIVEDNEGGATNFSGAYLVGTTLPSTDVFTFKYPITRFVNSTLTQNEIVLSVESVFAGTAPEVTAVYIQLIKVV
jgi:hypothetical protein